MKRNRLLTKEDFKKGQDIVIVNCHDNLRHHKVESVGSKYIKAGGSTFNIADNMYADFGNTLYLSEEQVQYEHDAKNVMREIIETLTRNQTISLEALNEIKAIIDNDKSE